jgi:hypothetical protein
VLITLVALTVAVVHLLAPDLGIDAVTLGLLVVAAVPWLGGPFKEIRVPGMLEAVYRDVESLREEVDRTDTRVESLSARVVDVERALVVTGASGAQEALIRSSLQGYRSYLASLHLPLGEFPRVEVTRGGVAYPDPANNRLVIGEGLANDPDAALHEYTHWVLEEAVDSPRADWAPSLRAIEAGMAYYLPRSFANTPALGFLDILRPNPALAVGEEHRVGQRVAGTLWELRNDVAPHLLDQACADAWLGSASADPSASETFSAQLGDRLGQRTGDAGLRARASQLAVVARGGSPGRGDADPA